MSRMRASVQGVKPLFEPVTEWFIYVFFIKNSLTERRDSVECAPRLTAKVGKHNQRSRALAELFNKIIMQFVWVLMLIVDANDYSNIKYPNEYIHI